ncbi:olfactory receptor 2AP1-like [Rana temporaria]|uniref:olfactory receptor 2AP1-like n=1 Tax=Rana temporaria TaxID=8407 RepID=UPI001AADBACB|nr:olfactory receptor 2AP1-like [Rana temporaria]
MVETIYSYRHVPGNDKGKPGSIFAQAGYIERDVYDVMPVKDKQKDQHGFGSIKQDLNKTTVQEFILIAFSNLRQLQLLLFLFVLIAYTICVTGNITIIVLVRMEPLLQTPMYFFISTFAVLEIMFMTVTIAKLQDNLISGNQRISVIECFTQMFILDGLGETECYLLLVMAFDRNLAINNPLHYSAIMKKEIYSLLAVAPWVGGFAASSVTTRFMAQLDFCGPNQINHFICDLVPVQILSCSDTSVIKLATILTATFSIIFSGIIIIALYVHIIKTILKIKGAEGKQKAFSTCSSHLIVASLFFGTGFVVYIIPTGGKNYKYLALIYMVLTPLLNPLIYTLRNSDVKTAAKKIIIKYILSEGRQY